MRVLEILLSKEQRDKDLSSADKKEVGLLKKKIDQYIDAISKPGTTPAQRASLHKKMTTAVAEVKKITEKVSRPVMEAVHKVPLTEEDFDAIKDMMEKPIPAAVSLMYLQEVIIDDELTDVLKSLEDSEPNRDIRPLIAEWVHRVMPDQLWRFGIGEQSQKQKMGIMTPIHGYDPHMYKGSNDPITGNAYGFR